MKVAVFHNFMDNIGGAEILSLILARELDADFYTTNIDEKKIAKMGFPGLRLRSIGRVPLNAPFRHQVTSMRFRRLNLGKKYDFYIIGGDWAVSAAVNNRPNLWYVHSSIREIWDLYEYTRQNIVPRHLRLPFDAWVHYNRYLNKRYVGRIDKIACNSRNTQAKVQKYLAKPAAVINPPIDTSVYHYGETGNYWLSVNRLITHKRVDMQIEAFSKLPGERLVIVGSYEKSRHFQEYARYVEKIRTGNVEILSWVDHKKLVDLYANCKGFLTTSYDEDFGMAPVEAMASGKPVIAPNEGGYKETVINGVTGKLIDDIDADKLASAVKEIGEKAAQYKDASLAQSKKFDTGVFINKIKQELDAKGH